MKAALAFLDGDAWSLTLLGGVGTGKTVPAAYLAKKTLEAGDTLVWWRAPNIATGSIFGPEAGERNKRACHAKLLVLDDLGAELATGPWVAMLEDVLGFRYAHKAKTVITGNLPLESLGNASLVSLRSLLRDRLFDRLREGVIVGTGNGSMRRRSA
jgi:DNA replication protein DnaC